MALRAKGEQPGVMASLRADGSWLSQVNRVERAILGRRFPRDTGCGYPVFRGWVEDGAAEVTRRFRPQLAIIQMPQPGAMLDAFARQGVPGAVYVHEVEQIDDLGSIGVRGVPMLANSSFTAGRLRDRCGVNAHVIRPLIDPAEYRVPTRRERVLFVNTVPRKGLEIVLRLAESRPDIPFDLVRSWILTPAQTESLRVRAAAAGNVTLHAPTRDMRPLYERARVLLAPSQWEEAWGRVATEAHVNGIPVLASDRGGLPEAVGPGGIVVPAQASLPEWLAALSELWDDPAAYTRYSQAAASYASRPEIQPATIVDKLQRLLSALRARGAARCE